MRFTPGTGAEMPRFDLNDLKTDRAVDTTWESTPGPPTAADLLTLPPTDSSRARPDASVWDTSKSDVLGLPRIGTAATTLFSVARKVIPLAKGVYYANKANEYIGQRWPTAPFVPETKYNVLTNTLLYSTPDGRWSATPP
jgi:hypothetical protein